MGQIAKISIAAAGLTLILLLIAQPAEGKFGYEVGGSLGLVYDDNIFLERFATSKDLITEIKPQLKLSLETRTLNTALSYEPFFTVFANNFDSNQLTQISQTALFDFGYLLAEPFKFQLSDEYKLTRGSEGQADFSRVNVFQNNQLKIHPLLKHEFSERMLLKFSPRYVRRDIEKVVADYNSFGAELKVERQLNAAYTLSLANDFERRQYDAGNSDFYLYTLYLILGIDLSKRLEAEFPVGYQFLKIDGQPGKHNQSYQVRLKYFVTPRLLFEPEFAQIFSADLLARAYNSMRLGGTLSYEFSPRLTGQINGEWRDIRYYSNAGTKVKDSLYTVRAELNYEISERFSILIRYNRAHNSGEDQTNNYAVNRYTLQASWRFGTAN